MALRNKLGAYLFVGAATGALLTAFPSIAAAADADQASIEELVVTARKQVETVVSTPVSITALSAEALDRRGITNFVTLSDFTPGFKSDKQVNNRNDRYNQVFVARGMNPGSDLAQRAVVTIFQDGVPLGRGAMSGITDIDRVEVIAGPQSAFYGRSTFAGAVNFITRPPSFDMHQSVDASYSSYNTVDVKASVEGGIIPDVLAARISGRYYATDGHFGNYAYPGKLGAQATKSIKGSLRFTPTPTTNIRLEAVTWQDNDGSPAVGQLYAPDYNCRTPTATVAPNYICGAISSVPSNRMTQQNAIPLDAFKRLTSSANVLDGTKLHHFGMLRNAYESHLIVKQELPGGYTLDANAGVGLDGLTVVVDTGDRDQRNIVNPNFGRIPGVIPYQSRSAVVQSEVRNTSAELRLSSPTTRAFSWTVGVNGFRARENRITYVFSNTGFATTVPYIVDGSNTVAVFGSANYDFTDSLSLSLEARQQSEKRLQVSPTANLRLTAKFKAFTPRAILSYHPTTNLNIYASYSEGTRPGEFNANLLSLSPAAQAQVQSQYDVPVGVPEERVKMGEFGVKGNFLDRRLQVLSAFYYGDWTGRHVTQTVTYQQNGNFQPVNVVVGGSRVKVAGVEAEVTYRATPDLTFEATYSYAYTNIRSTYELVSLQLLGNPNPVGNKMPHVPVDSGSVSVTYQREIMDGVRASIRLDEMYNGKQYDSEANLAWTPRSYRTNLTLGFERDDLRFEIFGRNIFNDKTPINIQRNTDAYTGQNTITVAPPLKPTVGVRIAVRH